MVSRFTRMKTFATTFLLSALLSLASCSKPEHSAIVGRWHEVGTAGLLAFHEDNTVEITLGESEGSGKYTFITDGKLKLELSRKGAALGPRVYLFSLAGDKMTLTDVEGQKTEYLKEK